MKSTIFPLAALALCVGSAGPVRGGPIDLFDISRFAEYGQDASGVTPTDFLFLSTLRSGDPSLDRATLTYPGNRSPWPYFRSSGQFGLFDVVATRSELDAAYPFGTYTATFTSTGGPNTASATIQYTHDATPGTVPAFTPATFQALQGLDPSRPFTLTFNKFTPDPAANESATFLGIFDPDLGSILSAPISPGATSYILPANFLRPDVQYTIDLLFQSTITGTDGTAPTSQTFSIDTIGNFTTAAAVPEPASLTLVLFGLGGLTLRAWRRAGRHTSGFPFAAAPAGR
jgi:hypothetical protein